MLIGITVGIASLAQATNFVSGGNVVTGNANGSVALTGGTAYIYQELVTPLAANAQLTGATITFNSIDLTSAGTAHNVLYYDLINNKAVTSTSFSAAEANYAAGQDYFTQTSPYSGESVQIGSTLTGWPGPGYFPLNSTKSWSTSFSGLALTDMQTDLQNGYFDIGFNPNCPYEVLGSITVSWTYTTPNGGSVPDQAMTAGLLGMSFLGLLAFRRKLAFN